MWSEYETLLQRNGCQKRCFRNTLKTSLRRFDVDVEIVQFWLKKETPGEVSLPNRVMETEAQRHTNLKGLYSWSLSWSDLQTRYTTLGEITLTVSLGYSIFDTLELLRYSSMKHVLLVLHHILLIFLILGALYAHQYLGVVILGLSIEVQSIFGYLRNMIHHYGYTNDSKPFRIITYVAALMFVTYRIPILSFILLSYHYNHDGLPLIIIIIGYVGIFGILCYNIYVHLSLVHSIKTHKQHQR
ncbi:TLC domain-containing protein 2-like isoform X1 [Amphiura filiformis]|uniref:TLC domain-containing protein 2-like isoform X1 n=1 Tax=Amphiura filiformis TaxID=82378 RepID=UPI003B2161D4